uniref:Putative secreted protein n=1 Tax=Rhipicephalus microplus TaxID=6941 RepID=A0A6G5A2D4_RHIMP
MFRSSIARSLLMWTLSSLRDVAQSPPATNFAKFSGIVTAQEFQLGFSFICPTIWVLNVTPIEVVIKAAVDFLFTVFWHMNWYEWFKELEPLKAQEIFWIVAGYILMCESKVLQGQGSLIYAHDYGCIPPVVLENFLESPDYYEVLCWNIRSIKPADVSVLPEAVDAFDNDHGFHPPRVCVHLDLLQESSHTAARVLHAFNSMLHYICQWLSLLRSFAFRPVVGLRGGQVEFFQTCGIEDTKLL